LFLSLSSFFASLALHYSQLQITDTARRQRTASEANLKPSPSVFTREVFWPKKVSLNLKSPPPTYHTSRFQSCVRSWIIPVDHFWTARCCCCCFLHIVFKIIVYPSSWRTVHSIISTTTPSSSPSPPKSPPRTNCISKIAGHICCSLCVCLHYVVVGLLDVFYQPCWTKFTCCFVLSDVKLWDPSIKVDLLLSLSWGTLTSAFKP